jgi:xanthine dehydrogenase iron-sulfur cluster and FAD-binding subunit A
VPVCQVDGSDVRTVEGLSDADSQALGPLQRAFLEAGGAQCGICTPGMLMAAQAYLDAGGAPDEEAIRSAIAGNLCRCTGYTKIIEAIEMTALGLGPDDHSGGASNPGGGAPNPGGGASNHGGGASDDPVVAGP